ncbi:MAG TPA: helix-turn-helix domain-containing protein [Acidimicrobiales bacterium]|nr:helix-turn-helix domain-containing protein [Acidimicrobiales bacterium]
MGESVSGVGVLDKAVRILAALETGPLALPDLVDHTDLPRATAHRLAQALEVHSLVERDAAGRFVLGSRLARLAGSAGISGRRTISEVAAPALARLRDVTGESAQLFVRAGDSRVCVLSLESPHSLRTIVPVGATLPMDRGSAAKVLRGDPAAMRTGWAQSVEEREKGVASVSAGVLVAGQAVAAVSVSGPIERTTRSPGKRYAREVLAAAREVEAGMSGG